MKYKINILLCNLLYGIYITVRYCVLNINTFYILFNDIVLIEGVHSSRNY